jgi:hypothetical protein
MRKKGDRRRGRERGRMKGERGGKEKNEMREREKI